MSSVGQLNHVLTNAQAGGNNTYTWTCTDGTTGEYRRTGDLSSVGTAITYDSTTGWSDHTGGYDFPSKFGTSATDATAITPPASATTLYLYDGSSLLCVLNTGVSSGGGSGGGSGTVLHGVNTPNVTWNFPHRPCGATTYVSVTHTATTSSATTYTVHDDTGQIGTILVGTGSTATANFSFTISARTLHVKDSSGSILSTRVFTCGGKKVFCNFW